MYCESVFLDTTCVCWTLGVDSSTVTDAASASKHSTECLTILHTIGVFIWYHIALCLTPCVLHFISSVLILTTSLSYVTNFTFIQVVFFIQKVKPIQMKDSQLPYLPFPFPSILRSSKKDPFRPPFLRSPSFHLILSPFLFFSTSIPFPFLLPTSPSN